MSYWKTETPQVVQTTKNELRIFNGAGKVQVYPRIPNSAHGVGKGATLDLDTMTVAELEELRSVLNSAIDSQVKTKTEKVG